MIRCTVTRCTMIRSHNAVTVKQSNTPGVLP